MLEGLHEIDWANYRHAYGSASDIPDLIESLTSDNEEVCQNAAIRLDHSTHHNEPLSFPCVELVLPFLVELLESSSAQHKQYILQIVSSFARGCSEKYVYYPEEEWHRVKEFQGMIGNDISLYLEFLKDENWKVKQEAAKILKIFPDMISELAPAIRTAIELEKDLETKTSLIESLGELLENRPDYSHFLESLINSHENRLIRTRAAMALTYVARENTQQDAIELLIQWNLTPPLELGRRAIEPLGMVGPEKGIPAILEVIAHSSQTKTIFYSVLLEILFNLIFAEPKKEWDGAYGGPNMLETYAYRLDPPIAVRKLSYEELTLQQRKALRAIVASDSIWSFKTNIFELCGLPGTREELRNFLEN